MKSDAKSGKAAGKSVLGGGTSNGQPKNGKSGKAGPPSGAVVKESPSAKSTPNAKSGASVKAAPTAILKNGKSGKEVKGKTGLPETNKDAKSAAVSARGKKVTIEMPGLETKGSAIDTKRKSVIGSQTGPSPPSMIKAADGVAGSHRAASVSNTETSVLGKRMPTVIVNPADILTMRTVGSDKSWLNVTIGGRRAPTEADLKNKIEAEVKRTRKAILQSAAASLVVFVLVLIVILSSWFGLSESAGYRPPTTPAPDDN